MNWTSAGELKVQWRAPVAVMTAAVVAIFLLLLSSPNFSRIAGLFLVIPLGCVGLIWLLVNGRRGTRIVCLMLLIGYGIVSWQMVAQSDAIRSEARWVVGSRSWKVKVLQQPTRPDSGMKCLIWDGWGMAGQDTVAYLVFSDNDGLRNYSSGNRSGLPMRVWRVQRLEKQWYSVTFYTNKAWYGCGVDWR